MSADSPHTLLPDRFTLDVLWRHQAVDTPHDAALGRIARVAAALRPGMYVRISLLKEKALTAVAEAGPDPACGVAAPGQLRITQHALEATRHPVVTSVVTSAPRRTTPPRASRTSNAAHWRRVVVPIVRDEQKTPLGTVESLYPVRSDASLERVSVENAAAAFRSESACSAERTARLARAATGRGEASGTVPPWTHGLAECAALVIAELQHRYERLRHTQTEEHLRQVAANLDSGLYRSTPESGIIYANQAFIDLLGYDTLDDVVRQPAAAFYATPDEQARLLEAEQSGNGLTRFPVALQRRDGTTFTAHISSTVKRDARGRVLYYDGVVTDVSEQQATRRALRRQEALFRMVAENAQPAVFVLDATGTFLLAEGRDLAAIGLETHDVVGTSVFDRYADFPEVLNGLRRALSGDEVRDTLYISEYVFEVWYSPLHEENGEVAGCVGMVANVTDRRASEEERLRTAERWERLVEAHPDPIVVSTGGVIRYINAAGVQLLGARDASDLVGKALFTFVVDDARRDLAIEQLRLVYEGNSSTLPTEYVIQWQDYPARTVEVRSVPITYNGTPAAQTIVRDITRQREMEQTLRAERDLLERIFNTSAAAITVTDAEGQIVEANERAENVLGLSLSDLEGRFYNAPDWSIESVDGGAFPERELPFERIKREGEPVYDVQHALCWDDGTRRIVSINGAPLRTAEGEFAGGVFTVTDITSRVEAEQELRIAKHEAEAASRLKTSMLANMSHEVRTPLTSILGFSEVLAEETTGTPQRFARLIEGSAQRLLTTLDSVLRLAKLEAGTEVLTPETVNLHRLVKHIVHEKQQQARRKGVTLSFASYSPQVHAKGGTGAMQRVAYNLISNAIKFTEPTGRVDVRLAEGPRGVLFEVHDTGIGMSRAFQRRMFKAFTQESEGLARRHEGSGLGLPIVRELVELMGGAIEVESTRGHGTRIAVYLPGGA